MLEKYESDLIALAKTVWENPEPGFREFKSSAAQTEYLAAQGFSIESNIAGTVTGYCASWGSGKPVIAFLAEFDALHGMSQAGGVFAHEIDPAREMGHGCGHHLLGTGAIAAGLLLRDRLRETGKSGTIRIYGCPAEEAGSGKTYMARDGIFADCDAALTWHPSEFNMVDSGSSQSCIQVLFRFKGVSAHAAGAPHLGRSALDAVELTDIGANYLREHMEDSDRIHYAITNTGGKAPNVVQSEAEVDYFVRSSTNPKCFALLERMENVARGAALMTGTELEILFDEGLSNTVPSFTLENVMRDAFREIGCPKYTEEERARAQAYKDTFPVTSSLSDIPAIIKDQDAARESVMRDPLCDRIFDTNHSETCSMGSTDVGDVSWVIPTCQLNVNCYPYAGGGHSWQWVASGCDSVAMKGMLCAGEVLARTAEKLIDNPVLLAEAKAELDKRLAGESYRCPIPDGIAPHYFD